MTDRLTLEVSVEQIAEVVHRMDSDTRRSLLNLAPELVEPTAFVTTITYHPDDNGYLARCFPIDAVAWGKTISEAGESLVDAVIEVAETLVENCPNPDETLRSRLPYAHIVYQRRQTPNKIKLLLGLGDNALQIP